MPRRKSAQKKSRSKKRKRKEFKRPYKLDKHSRALHRYRKRRHHTSRVQGHHKRQRDEAEMTNYLLHNLLKTVASTEYNYQPRHHSKDPEYKFSSVRTKEFKRGVPAPDTHFWRPQGKRLPPSRGNFPQWEEHYHHPHIGIY